MAETQDGGAPADAAATVVAPAPVEASPAVVEAPAADARADALRDVFGAWLAEHFYNSPVSRATEAFNYLTQTAIPDLEARILKEMT